MVTNNVGKGLGAYKAGICMWVVGTKVTTIVTYGNPSVFFWGKFQTEKYDFDLCEGILMKKNGPNSPDFEMIFYF